jgi:hypothetical protein
MPSFYTINLLCYARSFYRTGGYPYTNHNYQLLIKHCSRHSAPFCQWQHCTAMLDPLTTRTVQRSDAGRGNTAYCAVRSARQLYRTASRDSHRIQGHDKRDTVYADNRWPQLLAVNATWQKVTLELYQPTTHTSNRDTQRPYSQEPVNSQTLFFPLASSGAEIKLAYVGPWALITVCVGCIEFVLILDGGHQTNFWTVFWTVQVVHMSGLCVGCGPPCAWPRLVTHTQVRYVSTQTCALPSTQILLLYCII